MSAPFAPVDLTRVADVLDSLGAETEALGEALCADPAIVAAYLTQLQALDRIAQFQHALAVVLRSDCPSTAVAQTGLDELVDRVTPDRQR